MTISIGDEKVSLAMHLLIRLQAFLEILSVLQEEELFWFLDMYEYDVWQGMGELVIVVVI